MAGQGVFVRCSASALALAGVIGPGEAALFLGLIDPARLCGFSPQPGVAIEAAMIEVTARSLALADARLRAVMGSCCTFRDIASIQFGVGFGADGIIPSAPKPDRSQTTRGQGLAS